MKSFLKPFVALALGAALLLNTGCGTSAAESIAFAAITTAADALIASLGIAGAIPASDVVSVTAVTNAVLTAADDTTKELASSDTTAVKSAAIAGYWNTVLTQIKGLSPTAQAILGAVSADIQAYINIVAPAGATAAVDGSLIVKTSEGTTVLPAHMTLDRVSEMKRRLHIARSKHKLTKLVK